MNYEAYQAYNYLDKQTVLVACDKIDEFAKDYYNMGQAVFEAAGNFNENVLAIEGETLETLITQQADIIKAYEHQINELTDNIRSMVNQAYDSLQYELNTQKEADEATLREREQSNKNY